MYDYITRDNDTINIDDSYINEMICRDKESFFENTIPIIPTSNEIAYFTNYGNSTFIMYIDNTNEDIMYLVKNNKIIELNSQYKIYKINEHMLYSFIVDIINTEGKYVYPLVFVNFVKTYTRSNKYISFDDDELLKLRIWANHLRLTYNKRTNQKFSYNDSHVLSDTEIYLGYKICCEMLHYVLYVK